MGREAHAFEFCQLESSVVTFRVWHRHCLCASQLLLPRL